MKKTVELRKSDEAAAIAQQLIAQHHEHLAGARIAYLFTNQTRKRNGKVVWGTAAKTTALQKFLSGEEEGYHFIILIDEEKWGELTKKQRLALVDHELTHCDYDPTTETYAIRAHDVEEFAGIIRRHGLWKEDVEAFGQAVQQLELFERKE